MFAQPFSCFGAVQVVLALLQMLDLSRRVLRAREAAVEAADANALRTTGQRMGNEGDSRREALLCLGADAPCSSCLRTRRSCA